MEVFKSEIKVGLLVLSAFILLMAGIFITSDIKSLWDDKKSLVLLFPYADGLTRGSPVWYAGLEVGEVSDIRISKERSDRIAVTVRIDPRAVVRKTSRTDIRSLGMMGAKYVEISPGSSDSPELAPGELLEGKSPASLSEILETGQQAATRLADLVGEAKTLVHEIRTESSLKETLQNSNALLAQLRDQTKGIGPVIEKLSAFADTLNVTGKHVQQVAADGGKEVTALAKELRETNFLFRKKIDSVEERLAKTMTRLDQGLSEAEGSMKGVRSIVTSSEDDIASILDHLEDTTRHLDALSEDLRAHPWKIVWKKEGTRDRSASSSADEWREKGRIGPYGKE